MTELLELVVSEQAAAAGESAIVEFEAPGVVILTGQIVATPWTGDATLEVGTEGDPARFGSYKISAGRRTPLDQHRLIGDRVDEIVARVSGRASATGSGSVAVRLVVGSPNVTEAS